MTAAPLTPEAREALARHLLSRYGAFVAPKSDLGAVAEVARVFDVVRLFGPDLPTSAAFLDDVWTTVGPVVFRPRRAPASAGANLRPLAHEITHAVQFWRDPAAFAAGYLDPRRRAEMEAEAERGAVEVWHLATGELPRDLASLDVARHGYALDTGPGEHDDVADLARDLLEQAVAAVAAGVYSTDVGVEARLWAKAQNGGRP